MTFSNVPAEPFLSFTIDSGFRMAIKMGRRSRFISVSVSVSVVALAVGPERESIIIMPASTFQ